MEMFAENVVGGRILVHFDGWEWDYDYWVVPSQSPFIKPAGWCALQGIELHPPRGKANHGYV